MLDPSDRGALLEALRPPPGYIVDSAVATTYSLDLVALLTAPLAFSLYDRLVAREGKTPVERLDSLALLHAVRQHAERLVVFCQTGCIQRPSAYRQLLTYLEDSVVPVRAQSDIGVFHPKLWIQRFTCEGGPIRYRVLCLSRNLTFDRSWDTMLVIEGELAERKLAIGDSKPLAEFVEALPGLALDAIHPSRSAIVDVIADELRRVRFEVPDGFDAMRFWPLGHDGKRRDPFGESRIERLLVVSPFLASHRLEVLAGRGKNHVLVSRIEELQKIPREVLANYTSVHVLHDAAEEIDDESDEAPAEAPPPCAGLLSSAKGLHAKLYVADDGWNAHVWTGSANASDAAFGPNVEFLVQLTGRKSAMGVQKTLSGEGGEGLAQILGPFTPPETPVVATETEERLARMLRDANRALSTAHWVARADRRGAPDEREIYTVALTTTDGALPTLPDGCTVRVWPIALPADRALTLESASSTGFERCSFLALTTFFAFEVTATAGESEVNQFVVRVPLEGVPDDRAARVLHALLDDPTKVMRFLRLILSLDAFDAFDLLDADDVSDPGRDASRRTDSVALFESLVRTLDREPHRLLEVERLTRELKATPGSSTRLLPAGFEELWGPLWAAYQTMPRAGRAS